MDDARLVTIEKDGAPVKFRMMGEWVYVKVHEPKKQLRGIILPDTMSSDLRVGTVLARGPGADASNGAKIPIGVEPGEVVVFHRWNLEHKQGQELGQYIEDDAGLIKGMDVLVVCPPGSDPEVW